jgi:hypothetical protein
VAHFRNTFTMQVKGFKSINIPVIFYRIPSKSLTYRNNAENLKLPWAGKEQNAGRKRTECWRPFFTSNLPYIGKLYGD